MINWTMPIHKLLPKAETDLEKIWFYTVKTWGIEQANFYIDEIDNVFRLLAEQPSLCRIREELNPPVRIHHHAKHLIVYTEAERSIDIIRILHESMDIETQLSDG